MWPLREPEKIRIANALQSHVRPLPGLLAQGAVDVLAMQFIASTRREDYYRLVQQRPISANRADPNDPHFDAERAIAYHLQHGDVDEAAWLAFLMTHFAKPVDTGWTRLRDVYGRLGNGTWSWHVVRADIDAFSAWLAANWQRIGGKFGNHRKYESLRPDANRDMASVVGSYLDWIGENGHQAFFASVVQRSGNDPHTIFDTLFDEMPVLSFGRLAKFDYLSLVGRYGIAPIVAGSAYLDGATGPAKGARLLFDGDAESGTPNSELQNRLWELDQDLQVGMTIMEDALCNWQKSPTAFVHFRG